MKRAVTFGLSLTLSLLPGGRASAADPPKGKLHFVGVAYDEGPPPGQDGTHFNYAPQNFFDAIKRSAGHCFTHCSITMMLDKQVTKANVMRRLAGLARAAAKDDVVFVYWGTHGGTDADGWSANGADGVPILGREMKEVMANIPCPVVVAVSTCGSGGFVRGGRKDLPVPANVAAFCACRRKKTTQNPLDIAMSESMVGFADSNGDGRVTAREFATYVVARYHEWSPDEKRRDADDLPVLATPDTFPLDRPLAVADPARVRVVKDGKWYGGLALTKSDKHTLVRFLGYDRANKKGSFYMADEFVKNENILRADGPPAAMVEWKGAWYPASVLSRKGSGRQYKVHYMGWDASQDEDVHRSRIRLDFGVRDLNAVKAKD